MQGFHLKLLNQILIEILIPTGKQQICKFNSAWPKIEWAHEATTKQFHKILAYLLTNFSWNKRQDKYVKIYINFELSQHEIKN